MDQRIKFQLFNYKSHYCGIASGTLVVGNMGSDQSKSYTVLGDRVNIPSRLKGASSQYNVPILVSKETKDQVTDSLACREIDLIQVMGKDEPVAIFEPLYSYDDKDITLDGLKVCYEEGLQFYREQNWEQSDLWFSKCLQVVPNDGPSLVILERIKQFRKTPPQPDWNDVWQLKKK